MKRNFYEPNKRTERERLTLANEAKVFDALYGKELRKKGLAIFGDRLLKHGDDADDEEKEKWFQRVEEAIDFVENYQNMANSDDAINAVLCTGDFYLGQGDIFGDDKKSFTAKEKKNIEAYEAVSSDVLPEKKEDIVEYFKDKRKEAVKKDITNLNSVFKNKGSFSVSNNKLGNIEVPYDKEGKGLRHIIERRYEEMHNRKSSPIKDKNEIKNRITTLLVLLMDAIKHGNTEKQNRPNTWAVGYDLKGDTGEYINGTNYHGKRTFPFGLYKTKKEVDQFERIKSCLASLACKVNDMVVSLCKDEADFLKNFIRKRKKIQILTLKMQYLMKSLRGGRKREATKRVKQLKNLSVILINKVAFGLEKTRFRLGKTWGRDIERGE